MRQLGDLVDIVRLKVFIKEKISPWSGTVRKTMFPKNWSDLKIERVIREASENLIFKKGDRFVGVAKNGTQIEFRYDRVRKGMKNAFITFEKIN